MFDLKKEAGKLAKSITGSLVRSVVTGKAKDVIHKAMRPSEEKIQERVTKKLGYPTFHYKTDKEGDFQFKLSPVFFHEWLTNSPDMKGRILKDEESGQIYFNGHPLDNQGKLRIINKFLDVTRIQAASTASTFDAAMKLLTPEDIVSNQFKETFHVESAPKVIDTWLTSCFGPGLETDPTYANLLFKKWIVGTAKRALVPGSSLDGCFTLVGPTGTGKTRFFRDILPQPFDQRTGEVYCNIKNPRQFTESILGKTIVCFDELSVLEHYKVIETFKQLLTSQSVDVRLAYRRDPQRYLLRQGFGATVNREDFITDPTIGRRLWVVKLNGNQRLDFDYMFANRKALWQEAVSLAQSGFSSYLSTDEQRLVEEYNSKFRKNK